MNSLVAVEVFLIMIKITIKELSQQLILQQDMKRESLWEESVFFMRQSDIHNIVYWIIYSK